VALGRTVPILRLVTHIAAPRPVCFDLSRSVDAHVASTAQTGERAVAGVTSGLLSLGDEVTWEAVHFGVRQRLRSRITEMDPPHRFVDEMVSGAFHRFRHVHEFSEEGGDTTMVDVLDFASPLGPLGRLVDALVLGRYLTRFLCRRNATLRAMAEEKAG
jgi:ligand-binding SRPBCC domain-containing protein